MNLCLKTKSLRPNLIGSLFRFSTAPEIVQEQNDQVLVDDSDDAMARDAEIERKRNKSGLTPGHYNLVNGRRPYEVPKCIAHMTVKYNRKLYGKYGSASGVNPSLCWPTKQDIQERLEYEAVAFPYTIRQMIDEASQRRQEEQAKILKRDQEVAAKFEKLEQWKKELNDKVIKKATEAKAAKEKKERLVEEVRRHFGFTLDPRDERFQEMLAKREKEQKKQERLAKRDAKEKVMIANLQKKDVKVSGSSKA